jgi:hypothetical protein
MPQRTRQTAAARSVNEGVSFVTSPQITRRAAWQRSEPIRHTAKEPTHAYPL